MPRGGKPKNYPPELVASVAYLYAIGKTQEEIASFIGTTQKVIWKLMKRHGLKTRKAAKRNQTGERNHMWKGKDASYKALHLRLYRRYGQPSICEICGTDDQDKTYDWANLNGRYDDLSDYVRACRSCHWKMDKKQLNLGAYAQKGGAKCLQNI